MASVFRDAHGVIVINKLEKGRKKPFYVPQPRTLVFPLQLRVKQCCYSVTEEYNAPITFLRISFGNPSIPGAVFALSLPPALFSSSRVKSSSRRTLQELRSCLWNGSTCGNRLRTMYLTRSGLSRTGVFLLVANLLVTILKARPHGSFSTSPIKSLQH